MRTIPERRDYSLADYTREILLEEIADFEEELDSDHEVALSLTSFGKSVILNVTSIGFANPSTLFFYGFVNGQPAELIQHVSQLSFLLTSVKKDVPGEPPRRIGFRPGD